MHKYSVILLVAVQWCFAFQVLSFGQAEITAKLSHQGVDYYGMPLGYDGQRIAFVDPAGRLNFIPAKSNDQYEIVSKVFKPYSSKQIQTMLEAEFADRYYISTTDHFVVVHPWGSAVVYAKPFETFYRRFIHFFASHGIELREPKTPLIAIVLRSRNDFDRYLINEIELRDSRIGGYYSRISNRIMTYDPAAQIRENGDRWIYKAAPIIHEATHQSAFNTGLHNRYSPPPKWLSEGLASLFEANGFNHSRAAKTRLSRVNAIRLKQLRAHLNKGSINAALINLIANDRLFESDVELAYALSWGLSFYLFETNSEKYFEFLKQDGQRENFRPYPADQRLQDFMLAFGNDFESLEIKLKQHFAPQEQPPVHQ